MIRRCCALLFAAACIQAQSSSPFGPTVKGLRASLAVTTGAGGDWLELTFENVSGKAMYLPLGRLGSDHLAAVRMTLLRGRQESGVTFRSRDTVAPSRSEPLIVPLMPGARYIWRSPLRSWDLSGAAPEPALLRAWLSVGANEALRHVNCFGLQIFWSGELVSNSAQLPQRVRR